MIRFGPSGNSDLFYDQGYKTSLDAPLWLKNRGLNAYEYGFTRGVRISDFVAQTLGENCKKHGVEVSVHAPYYINLANPDPEMVNKSFEYILQSLKYLKITSKNLLKTSKFGFYLKKHMFAGLVY